MMIDKSTLRAYCKYTQRNEIVKMGIMRVWSLRNSKNTCCTRLRIDGKQFFQGRKPAVAVHEGTMKEPNVLFSLTFCFHDKDRGGANIRRS